MTQMRNKIAKSVLIASTALIATQIPVGGGAERHSSVFSNVAKADDQFNKSGADKLPASDFAPGTIYTPAGWTRSTNAKTATKSKLTFLKNIPDKPTVEWNGGTPDWGMGVKIDFTISKSDIKKGNNIILSAIQFQNADYKNESATKNRGDDGIGYAGHGMRIGTNTVAKGTFYWTDPTGKKIKIGTVYPAIPDDHEVDFMLTITYDGDTDQFDSDLTGSININTVFGQYNQNTPISRLAPYTKDNPFRELVTTSSNQYSWTYYKDFTPSEATDLSDGAYDNPTDWFNNGLDKGVGNNSYNIDDYRTAINGNPMNVSKKQYKVFRFSGTGVDFTNFGLAMGSWMCPIDQNNRLVRNDWFYWQHTSKGFNWKALGKNLTPKQMYEELAKTPNSIETSKQDDGSVLVGFNTDISGWYTMDSPDFQKALADYIKQYSWTYNKASDADKQKILDNTLKFYANAKLPYKYWLYIQPAPTYTDGKRNPQYSEMTLYNIDGSPMQTQDFTYLGDDNNVDISTYRHVQVKYIDKDTGRQVGTDYILGSKNTTTTYDANKKKPANYIFAPGQKQNIKYTFNEDQKQNDNNPIIIYLTHAQKQVNSTATSTRTITYQGAPANLLPQQVNQTINYSGQDTVDSVTNTITKKGDLKPAGDGIWHQVNTPNITGYTPDLKVVQEKTPKAGDHEDVVINYTANDEKAKLRVIDDHTGSELQGYDEEANGKYDTAISFDKDPNDVAKELENKGYKVVSNSWQDGSKYQDGKNEFVIHVDHTTSTQTENHAQTRTIHYVDGKGNKMNDDVVQKASFTRTGTKDNVTGQIDWKDWTTNDKYAEVASSAHDGYTPDKAKVDAVTPLYGQNQDQTVVYHRNGQGAEITYIDDTTGKILKHEQAQGKYNDKIVFNSNVPDTIKGYENDGYVLVSNDFKDQNYSSDNVANKFTVHFKHGTKQVTRDKNVSQDIDYQIKENGTTHSVNHYKAPDLKFTQSGIQDQVTKETDWNRSVADQQFKAVNTSTIKGYTPDIKQVPATNIHVDSKNWNQNQNIKKTVTYTPDTETVKVIAKDRDTNKILNQSQLTGTYGSDYHATAPKIIGYHLVKSPANASGKFGTNNADVVYLYVKDTPTDNSETTGTPKTDNTSVFQQNLTKQDTKDLPEMSEANMAVATLAGLGLLTLTGLVPIIRRKIRN